MLTEEMIRHIQYFSIDDIDLLLLEIELGERENDELLPTTDTKLLPTATV